MNKHERQKIYDKKLLKKIIIVLLFNFLIIGVRGDIPKSNQKELINEQRWFNYIETIIRKGELYQKMDSQRERYQNINYYLENKQVILKDFYSSDANLAAIFIDIDGDQVDELWLIQREGSGNFDSTLIFKKQNKVFKEVGYLDSYAIPYLYQGRIYFIGVTQDMETKNPKYVNFYRFKGLKPIVQKQYQLDYQYDLTSILHSKFKKIPSRKDLKKLVDFSEPISEVAQITKKLTENEYHLEVIDEKYNRKLEFYAGLFFRPASSPLHWDLRNRGKVTIGNIDEDEYYCRGFTFFRDNLGYLSLLKAFYCGNKVIIRVYRFEKNSLKKVLETSINPKIVIHKN